MFLTILLYKIERENIHAYNRKVCVTYIYIYIHIHIYKYTSKESRLKKYACDASTIGRQV